MNVKLRGLLALALLLGAGHWAQTSMAQEFLPRIVGGNVVPDDRYPFMAALYRDADGDGNFSPTCGGSLLGDQWVLTAAHCVVDADSGAVHRVSEVALLLGTRDLSSSGGLFIHAQRIIVHPGYSTSDFSNDIALIELAEAVDGKPITLPSAASALPEIGESAVVTGWGVTRENGEPSSLLREVAVPIVSHAQCLPYYPETLQQALQLCAEEAVPVVWTPARVTAEDPFSSHGESALSRSAWSALAKAVHVQAFRASTPA
jgi:secreted trypsin-like serine protease